MGTIQSSFATASKELKEVISKKQVAGERGRNIEAKEKSEVSDKNIEDTDTPIVEVSHLGGGIVRDLTIDMTDTDSEYSSSDESDEDNEEDLERLLIVEDAKKLKVLATAFLHPEVPVSVDCTATARCYFDRNSAAEQENVEASLYRSSVLDDVTALKALASDYAHPEKKVSTEDPSVYGRCYFNQPSASEQEDVNDMEDRIAVLEDVKNLRVAASFYLHPESTVGMGDSTAKARCFFSRPSAVEQEDIDFAEEKAKILLDAAALKSLAVDYAHPEIGVTTVDATAYGHNYFSTASAVEQENEDEAEERAQILADATFLKKLAVDYAHPERGVTTADSTVFARNYFSRPSAIEQENEGESEERAQILADATFLKMLAVDYAHPEIHVTTTDPAIFGRNYFSRASTVEQENEGESEEKVQILADATSLKRLAVDYAHPEIHVTTTDPATFGRNYFSRASAVEQENEGESEERAHILADATSLKRLAVDYAHPEIHVTTTEPATFGRNYFSRASAVEQENEGESEEKAQILADATSLKRLAVDYAHPEIHVTTTESATFGRNYFSRASAVEREYEGEAEERAQILADATSLKRLAVDYAHPEHGVSTTDATAFGRNYFTMLSIGKPLETPSSPIVTKDLVKNKIVQKQQPVTSKLSSGKEAVHNKLSDTPVGDVKRSPSTVILFGLGDDDGSAY